MSILIKTIVAILVSVAGFLAFNKVKNTRKANKYKQLDMAKYEDTYFALTTTGDLPGHVPNLLPKFTVLITGFISTTGDSRKEYTDMFSGVLKEYWSAVDESKTDAELAFGLACNNIHGQMEKLIEG